MQAYNMMIKTNHALIRGEVPTDAQKKKIAKWLRAHRVTDGRRRTFDAYAYPRFYFPPVNGGKKLQTIIPISPKTNIVADNAYEYEILRLLHMFDPDDEVTEMVEETKERLRHTCFGYQRCHYAECFEAGMMVLRFLAFAAADDEAWMQKQIDVYNKHFGDAKHHSGVQKFYWYILSEMPMGLALPQIEKQAELILAHLGREYPIKTGNEDVALYAMRNALARLPQYMYLKERKPHVNEKTGKIYFEIK
ncbi:MAG: hypothetical protein FWC71_02115 [Defluviitaleaceae bacterium]|nr:hypothetical protein [Defluviitaleaceae bacterium]